MNTSLADFVRRHSGLRINNTGNRPAVMYNNWAPFRDNINDTLIINLAKTAAELGVTHFTIDAGWYTTEENLGKNVSWIDNMGDYVPDNKKFPDGIKPVFEEIRKLGLKTGLWISVGSATKASQALKNNPEWAVRDDNGDLINLHSPDSERDQWTMCFGTEWKEYIKNKILNLVRELNLSYVKLDLSVVTSAYSTEINKAGCSAKDHPFHKDREESLIVIYERLFELFDELHQEAPDLYIDCTFETAGKLQLIDYAFCQHAEGNWLTNIGETFPVGAFRIRNLAWWKSPVIPASSLIIGNLQMNSPEFIQELKTLIGSFPIVLGDLRQLSEEKKVEIKQWISWISEMQQKYDYDLYRQDIPGFGEPMEGSWDGWMRINTDSKKGGIIGVFRHGSLDNERRISIPGLSKNDNYKIKRAPLGEEISVMNGEDLAKQGFKVFLEKNYDSVIFEIELAE
jgi:alpha-galactosidase